MKPKLYTYFRSSASYRVRIALHLKGLEYEPVFTHLLKDGGQHHSPEFRRLNPMEQIPCWVEDQFNLTQSMAILFYLESLKPTPELFPKEARLRAQVIEFCEIINSGMQPFQNLGLVKQLKNQFSASDDQVTEWIRTFALKGFTALELKLQQAEGPFCFGSQLTAADVFLVPQVYSAGRFRVPLDQFPKVQERYETLLMVEAFKLAHPSQQPDFES